MPLISFNVGRSIDRLLALERLVKDIKPMAILIQDCPLTTNEEFTENCSTIAPKYKIFRLIEKASGKSESKYSCKVATLVREDIKCHRIRGNGSANATGVHLENSWVLAIAIQLEKGKMITKISGSGQARSYHKHFAIYNVYMKPKCDYKEYRPTFEWIKKTASKYGPLNMVVMGDFNSISLQWERFKPPTEKILAIHEVNIKRRRSKAVCKFIKKNKLIILNKTEAGPTHTGITPKGTQTQSRIDLALVGFKAHQSWNDFKIEQVPGFTHDHKIIIAAHKKKFSGHETKYHYDLNRIKSDHFVELREILFGLLRNNLIPECRQDIIEAMNYMANLLKENLIQVQEKIRIRKALGETRFSNHARKFRKLLRKLKANQKIARELNFCRKQVDGKSKEEIETMDRNYHKASQIVLRLRKALVRAINEDNDMVMPGEINQIVDNYKETKAAASDSKADSKKYTKDHFAADNEVDDDSDDDNYDTVQLNGELSVSTIDFGPEGLPDEQLKDERGIVWAVRGALPYRRREYDIGNLFNLVAGGIKPVILNEIEIDAAMSQLSRKRYIDVNGISFAVFNASYSFIHDIVKVICEMSFYASSVPECFCVSLGKLIKKGDSNKVRLLHVTSVMAALMERIAFNRLQYRLQEMKALQPYQFGYRQDRDKNDLMTRILEMVMTNRRRRLDEWLLKGKNSDRTIWRDVASRSTIIKLDIKGAFDTLRQDYLIDRLLNELGGDPIRFWISHYLLQRKIVATWEGKRTDEIEVTSGVCQGSCLGPILWNFALNDLHRSIENCRFDEQRGETVVEILAFSDDIYVVFNQPYNPNITRLLVQIVKDLGNKGLTLNYDKCQLMHIYTGRYNHRDGIIKLNGIELKPTKRMLILGMMMIPALKLDTDWLENDIICRRMSNIRLLYHLQVTDVVDTASEWHQLIHTYIVRPIVDKYLPILAIHPYGRTICAEMITKIIRAIFDWPNLSPPKLIRLLLKQLSIELMLESSIDKKIANNNCVKEGYEMLKLFHDRTLLTNHSLVDVTLCKSKMNPIAIDDQRYKRFWNPNGATSLPLSWWDTKVRIAGTWVIRGCSKVVTAVIFVNSVGETIDSYLYKHTVPNAYFGIFAALSKLTMEHETWGEITKRVIIAESNPIIMALTNYSTTNARVIDLREQIIRNGWSLYLSSNANIASVPLQSRETADTIMTYELSEPNFDDYTRSRDHEKKHLAKETEYFAGCHTKVTKALCANYTVWQKLIPSWINGSQLAHLSGFCNAHGNDNDREEKNAATQKKTCHKENKPAHRERKVLSYEPWAIKKGRPPAGCSGEKCGESDYDRVLLHRFFECTAFDEQRRQYKSKLATDGQPTDDEEIITTYKYRKLLFEFLEECSNAEWGTLSPSSSSS